MSEGPRGGEHKLPVTRDDMETLRASFGPRRATVLVIAYSTLLILVAVLWFYRHGYLLYWGDAQAHLNISRRIIDSRTPGYDQIGGVWLPALHILCLPFVGNDWLWSTGLAGSIPAAICFVITIAFVFRAAHEAYDDMMAASITAACVALNPNLLYLDSIPMTEPIFLATTSVLLFSLLRFRRTQNRQLIVLGGFASIVASLTRYDGWFLIPFAAAGFFWFAKERRFSAAFLFCVLASLAPLYWFAHNYWETGDVLDFYRGPYSAKAIYQRALDAGGQRYRGDHQWGYALLYYSAAGVFCTGYPLVLLGLAGTYFAARARRLLPILFLLLTPIFYVLSMYSSGTPIFVPSLWPFGYYNTRYGISVLPLAAFGAGALVLAIPARWRRWALAIPLAAVLPWLVQPAPASWICWKESEVNSLSRLAWTEQLASFFQQHYRPGDGILMSFGDQAGVLSLAGIHLAESLHEGNGPAWTATTSRLDILPRPKWAIAQLTPTDPVFKAIDKANWKRTLYETVLEIHTKNDPPVRIYRRVHGAIPPPELEKRAEPASVE